MEVRKDHHGFPDGTADDISKNSAIWVIVDWLTKTARFIPIRTNFPLAKLTKLYIKVVVRRYGVPSSIVSDRDP